MAAQQPIAFMSYVRSDDEHESGRVTQFRERLSGEVRVQTGEEFPIFQDRTDILWGQNWKERVEDTLDEVTFLIPVITPSFFRSGACREELERFLERENELGRSDLVLPVYYVGCPLLDDKERRAKDPLAEAIGSRQYADWRELRWEPFASPQVGRMLEKLAVQIRDALGRVAAPATPPGKPTDGKRTAAARRRAGRGRPAAAPPQEAEPAAEGGETARGPTPKTDVPTRVADPMHRGDHATITEAIQAANPGDRIIVRPGLYQEGMVIDKPLEIIGDGPLDEIVVQATGQKVVLFKAAMGRVANLTLRQMGGGNWYGVDIAQGRLELEENDIFGNAYAAVAIRDGGNPTLQRNQISKNREAARVYRGGGGTFEDNDLRDNARGAWVISADSEGNVKRDGNQE